MQALSLTASPRSVPLARSWVADVLLALDRPDLVDSAELGVSELVTNAILHSASPVAVRVRGSRKHPRIEVSDQSSLPPRPGRDMTDDDQLMSTVGRGLGMVAALSARWGSDIHANTGGKTVWFEPATELTEDSDNEGDLFDWQNLPDEPDLSGPGGTVTVTFLDFPVVLFGDLREHYNEMRREFRLLAIADGERHPIVREVSDLTVQVERERLQAAGVAALHEAMSIGVDRLDLTYHIPLSAPATMARLHDLLEEADRYFADDQMLALSPTPGQLRLRRWYLSEFPRQARGEPPTPWPGPFELEPPPQ